MFATDTGRCNLRSRRSSCLASSAPATSRSVQRTEHHRSHRGGPQDWPVQALRDRAWRADLHNACLWLHIIASLIETEAISRLAVRVAHDDPGGIHRPV